MDTNDQISRCLYCSLWCPVALDKRSANVYRPDYVDQSAAFISGGLCYRGHYVSALKAHPRRLSSGWVNPPAAQPEKYSVVLKQAADILRAASDTESLGVLLSGQMPVQDLASAVQFFQTSMPARHISVMAPPTDAALFGGLQQGQAEVADFADIDKAGAVLAVGDVLGTHPLLAKSLLDMRERSRRNSLINVDALKGRTSRFATQNLLIPSGTEVEALVALAKAAGGRLGSLIKDAPRIEALLDSCGLERAEVEGVVERLQADKESVILLTLPMGRCPQNELLTAVCCLLAKATGSKILPLYTIGGSAGGMAVARSLGLSDFTDWLKAAQDGEFSGVFVAGDDPVGTLPGGLAAGAWDKIDKMVVATALNSATSARGSVVLPLGFWFEMSGDIVDHKGNREALMALGEAPGAAETLRNLINQIAQAGDLVAGEAQEVDIEKGFKPVSEGSSYPVEDIEAGPTVSGDSFLVTARTETIDLYEGDVSRLLDWVVTLEPEPVVMLNPSDAARLQLKEYDCVAVGGNGNQVEMSVRFNDAIPERTAAVSPFLRETRGLFEWRISAGNIEISPTLKQLHPASTEDK